MKTKIKIAVIAMMGISFGMNAQTEYPVIQSTQKVNNSPWYGLGRSNVIFPSSTHEAIQLGGFYGILLKTGKGDFRFDYNGNLGIGTANPRQKLELYNSNVFNSNMEYQSQDHILLSSSYKNVGEFFGGITWDSGGRRRASIAATREHSDADFVGLAFFTQGKDGAGPYKESMRISHSGNVGIGIPEPFTNLQIHSASSDSRIALTNNHSGSNVSDGFVLINESDSEVHFLNRENTSLKFSTNGKERVRVAADGNLGVGTDNPGARLEIKSDESKFIKLHRPQVAKKGHIGYGTANDGGVYIGTDDSQYSLWVQQNGHVGIGTYHPGAWKLAVNGKIRAKEIKVETGWSDFVFYDDYKLPTLEEVESHIKEKGHLKDIPSAKEVEENGVFLGEMDSKLLQKIEELTLYTIDQDKEIKALKKQNAKIEQQQKEINELKTLVNRLLKAKN
ncbi:conserved exported protein of unknown function [Tenacibaculum sp. 190524A02b]|uniref:hypothetical protein n=1 Tax=Tenacibaculum vairaonense TaxID=3137860 RepID=UPI0032B2A7F2